MGPGFFPFVLALVLLLIGLAAAVRSFLRAGPPVIGLSLPAMALVLGGVVAFAALLQGAGLAVALIVVVLASAHASIRFRWRSAILLAGAVSALSVLVFAIALHLPVPVVGRWLTG
jgi:putative tricarboxylic transport membrane protein